jgi:GMC oxidoreductase
LRLWGRAAQDDPGHDIELASRGNRYFCTSKNEMPMLMSLISHARAAGVTGVEYLDRDRTREVVPATGGFQFWMDLSVVDTEARVNAVNNLRVVDASIMPRVVTGS